MSELRLLERFLRYVKIDTQSDPSSDSSPTTEKQKNLSRLLVEELINMGVTEAEMTEHGYVYAHIPATGPNPAPPICFCAHVDTAPDCSGKDVVPQIFRNYDGGEIRYPDDPELVLSPAIYPILGDKKEHTIITASGQTLLGGDDKAGVAIIMEAINRLLEDRSFPHGPIKLLFTTDEEVGRGVDHVDIDRLGAKYGYTLDGGPIGTLEDETFSADAMTIYVQGVSAHPGYAKGIMKNAIKIAAEILAALPKDKFCPEATEGRAGFVHPTNISGELGEAEISFLLRDFDTTKLDEHASLLESTAKEVIANYPGASVRFERKEQYRNMKEVLDQHPEVVANAEQAIRRTGLAPEKGSIRGGTDGSRLSFMGLPCPNLFAGEQAIHSRIEWVSLQDMEKSVETVTHLCSVWYEKS